MSFLLSYLSSLHTSGFHAYVCKYIYLSLSFHFFSFLIAPSLFLQPFLYCFPPFLSSYLFVHLCISLFVLSCLSSEWLSPFLFDRLALKYLRVREREENRGKMKIRNGGKRCGKKKVKWGIEGIGRKRRKERANDRTEKERDPSFLLSFLSFH